MHLATGCPRRGLNGHSALFLEECELLNDANLVAADSGRKRRRPGGFAGCEFGTKQVQYPADDPVSHRNSKQECGDDGEKQQSGKQQRRHSLRSLAGPRAQLCRA